MSVVVGVTRWKYSFTKRVTKVIISWIIQERLTIEGDSPVNENNNSLSNFPSNTGLVEIGVNSGGPPPKAKYYLMTDSVKVAWAKDEKNPF